MEAGLRLIPRNKYRVSEGRPLWLSRLLKFALATAFAAMFALGCLERSTTMETEIVEAVRACDQKRVASLYNSDSALLNELSPAQETLLMISIENECVDLSRDLISQGIDVNAQDSEGGTALMRAARLKDTTLLELLLEKGANANAVNDYGESAMWDAIGRNNPEGLRILVDAGVDTRLTNFEGQSAIDAAQTMGYEEILRILNKEKE